MKILKGLILSAALALTLNAEVGDCRYYLSEGISSFENAKIEHEMGVDGNVGLIQYYLRAEVRAFSRALNACDDLSDEDTTRVKMMRATGLDLLKGLK